MKKNRKEKHQITRILSKCEGPKVKSKQCRPQLAIWVVSFHALWCQELWNGSTPFQLKHRVIYYRVLTIKPLEDRDLKGCTLFVCICSLLNKVEKILKGSLDSIPSSSPLVKIQIMCGKLCLRCKAKTLLGKEIKTKNSNVHNSLKVMGLNLGYLLKFSLLYFSLLRDICSYIFL